MFCSSVQTLRGASVHEWLSLSPTHSAHWTSFFCNLLALKNKCGQMFCFTLLHSFTMEPVAVQCQCSAVNNRMLLNLAQSTLSCLLLSAADIFYLVSSKVVAMIRFHFLLDFFTSKPTEYQHNSCSVVSPPLMFEMYFIIIIHKVMKMRDSRLT